MKSYHYIFLITGLAVTAFSLGSSCKRNQYCKKKAGTCRSVLEAKDFFLFKEGSWWVYEEENTHQRDSQYVYEYNNTSGYDFDMRVHSTLADYNYHFWPIYAEGAIKECSESEPVSGKCIYIYRNKWKYGGFVGQGICFFVNYKLNDWTYGDNYSNSNDKITVANIYDTYQVPAGNFSQVIVISEDGTLIEHNQPTKHYYVKNVGLIRKELIDSNQVWNLVNYHIES